MSKKGLSLFPIAEQAGRMCLKKLELCKLRLLALNFALSGEKQRNYHLAGNKFGEEFNALFRTLYQRLHEAYQDVFMFGLIEESVEKEARRLALKEMLIEEKSIMHYLNIEGITPGSWAAEDEETFREEIKALREELESEESEEK